MKEIKAIIRPFKLDDVVTALQKIEGLPGLTISEIKGFGRSRAKGAEDSFRDGLHNYIKRVKIELVVHNDIVNEVVDVIQRTAHTGNTGDGKIFVIEVADTIRIRTNERGEDAI
ncbi:P-II family nitrogen regulator [Melioribacter sp. Ez-97]|uniref:P-II family nitrogen regulator n=1 Tax=Melioribacter sp. Ez-97 TaxID=3423434 RepID=UPI003ED9D57C